MQNYSLLKPGRRVFLAASPLLLWLLGGCGGGSSAPTGTTLDAALIGRYVSISLSGVPSALDLTFIVLQNGRVEATLIQNGVTYRTVGNATNNQVEFEFKVNSGYSAFGGPFVSTNNTVQVKGGHAI